MIKLNKGTPNSSKEQISEKEPVASDLKHSKPLKNEIPAPYSDTKVKQDPLSSLKVALKQEKDPQLAAVKEDIAKAKAQVDHSVQQIESMKTDSDLKTQSPPQSAKHNVIINDDSDFQGGLKPIN